MDETTQLRFFKLGLYVTIETKTGDLINGFIEKILSKKDDEQGIRVRLKSGEIGHVIKIPSKHDLERETFKYYNVLFHEKIFVLRHRQTKEWISLPHEQGTLLLINSQPNDPRFHPHPDWYWQAISPQRNWGGMFQGLTCRWILVNHERLIDFEEFKRLEKKFKEMP